MRTVLYGILFTARVGILAHVIRRYGLKAGAASFVYMILTTISDEIRRGEL